MSKTVFWISILLVLGTTAWGIWGAMSLPQLDQYPVHWNAQGEPDRYSTRGEAIFNMFLMPGTAIFLFGLLWAIPKIEPLRNNLEESGRAYGIIMISLLVLFAGIQLMIVHTSTGGSADISVKWIAGCIGLVNIVIGNVLSKFRQNFFVGIRTPWTLTSELSWEKTHRLTGRLFVLSGLLVMMALPLMDGLPLLGLVIAPTLLITIFALIYSYNIWKSDPDKRQK